MSPARGTRPTRREVDATVALLATLANPLRLQLLLALSREGPLSAGELQTRAGAEQSAVSHQLATLRKARLVSAEREGRHMIYSLLDHHVAHIVEDAFKHATE